MIEGEAVLMLVVLVVVWTSFWDNGQYGRAVCFGLLSAWTTAFFFPYHPTIVTCLAVFALVVFLTVRDKTSHESDKC